jgi:hypothetical protein
MSRRDLSVKGGTSERCYRMRRGRTDEQRYAIISLYFDGRIKMNGPYPEITNISFLAKLFFKTFISLKHLSDYRTVGLWSLQNIHRSIVKTTTTVKIRYEYRTHRMWSNSSLALLDWVYFSFCFPFVWPRSFAVGVYTVQYNYNYMPCWAWFGLQLGLCNLV